jgi:hypothetical protein
MGNRKVSPSAISKSSSRGNRKQKKKSPRRTKAVPQLPAPNRAEATQLALVQPQALQTAQSPERGLSRRDLAKMHADIVGAAAYMELSCQIPMPPELLDAAGSAAIGFQHSMRPRDGVERLAISQMLLAHSRAAWLTHWLARQKDMKSFAAISEGCERAAGTFVRLMRAFREHREPRSAGATVSIGQANVGQSQIIQNLVKQEVQQKQNGDDQTRMLPNTPASTPALPTNAERIALPAVGHSTNAAVAKKHRPSHSGRKKPSGNECIPLRPTVGRHDLAAKVGDKDH